MPFECAQELKLMAAVHNPIYCDLVDRVKGTGPSG